jgi:transcriptional regulator with XRE-family HTH domain
VLPHYQILGNNIRRLRVGMKLTQERLAEDADLALRYIQEIEAGEKGPSLAALLRIRKVLRCRWDNLLAKL